MSNHQNNRMFSSSYTRFDVLTGRGKGVHSHPGNINYRKLVFVNKGLYDNCPESDKVKISRGIILAVGHLGGRFLKFDKRKDQYCEITELEARKKTSQALRDAHSGKVCETSLYMASINAPPTESTSSPSHSFGRSFPEMAYFGYSVQVLGALFTPNHDISTIKFSPEEQSPPPAAAKEAALPPLAPVNAHAAAKPCPIDMAMDQFPGAKRHLGNHKKVEWNLKDEPEERHSTSLRDLLMDRTSCNRSTIRSTMSLRSTLSIGDFADQFFRTSVGEERNSIESILTQEIRELIRSSDTRLRQVDEMDADELFEVDEFSISNHEDTNGQNDDDSVMSFDVTYDNPDPLSVAQSH